MLVQSVMIGMVICIWKALAADCVWDPEKRQVISEFPVGPYTNCLRYCEIYYSRKPQRKYYNITSQMCEPRRICTKFTNYYYYPENKCYTDQTLKNQAQSQIPESLYDAESLAHPSIQMICVNGFMESNQNINGVVRCVCETFWKSSGKVDLNGFPFQCDEIQTDAAAVFYNKLQFDSSGNIKRYGPYTPSQLQIVLDSLKTLEHHQTMQYTYKNYESILYALNQSLPQEQIIRKQEILIVITLLLLIIVVLWISYYQYNKLRIQISQSRMKEKIIDIVNNNNQQAIIRSLS